MIAGVMLGIYLYMKSFNIMLAIVLKKVYNLTVIKIMQKRKQRKLHKGEHIERRKGKKDSCSINSDGSATANNSFNNYDLSNLRYRYPKEENC